MTTIHSTVDREEIARQHLIIRKHENSATHLRQAVEYFLTAGLPLEAAGPLKSLVALDPRDVSLRLLQGAVAAELGDIAGAESAFREATRLAPEVVDGYHNLGVLYCAAGQLDKAEEQFKTILRLHPNDPETLNDLAVLYASTERPDQAQVAYEQCLTAAPEYKKCWTNALHFAFAAGRFVVGSAWTSRLLAANPGDVDLLGWHKKFIRARREIPGTDQQPQTQPLRGRVTEADLAAPPVKGTVSVIVPAYNAENTLPATIESILAQTYSPIEIVVVDDGSLDATPEIIAAYGSRIVYLGRVHAGWAAAANEGLQHARGEWIMLLDPGDLLQPEAVKNLLTTFDQDSEYDVVYGFADEPRAPAPTDDVSTRAALPLFRRKAFVRLGFFAETAADENGTWARELMIAGIRQFGAVGTSEHSPYLQRATWSGCPEDPAYGNEIRHRWLAEIGAKSQPAVVRAPEVRTSSKTGLQCLIIGATDPGGMLASYARAINAHSVHRCSVVVHKTRMPVDSQVTLTPPDTPAAAGDFDQRVQELAKRADWLIFAAGIGAGAVRRDGRLEDTDEVPFGPVNWRSHTGRARCAALLCSSPAVRGNYQWYHQRFTARGWRILTPSPDICLHVPGSVFVPPVVDLDAPEYTRGDFSIGPVAVTFHERPPYVGGRHQVFVPLIAHLKKKHGDNVLFGRCSEMTQRDTLLFRQRIHIGFDRLSFGAPRFGLTSLENSALGLVNIVYLDEYSRAVLARTLGTDQLPWLSPDSSYALYEMLDQLVTRPDDLRRKMMETAAWVRQFWAPEKMVRRLCSILNDEQL